MQCRAFRFRVQAVWSKGTAESRWTIRLSRPFGRLQRVGRGSPLAACSVSGRDRLQIHLLDVRRQVFQRGALQIVVDR